MSNRQNTKQLHFVLSQITDGKRQSLTFHQIFANLQARKQNIEIVYQSITYYLS